MKFGTFSPDTTSAFSEGPESLPEHNQKIITHLNSLNLIPFKSRINIETTNKKNGELSNMLFHSWSPYEIFFYLSDDKTIMRLNLREVKVEGEKVLIEKVK